MSKTCIVRKAAVHLYQHKTKRIMANYIARYAHNIEADKTRNWGSWNFGNSGIKCTADRLWEIVEECIESGSPLNISDFDIYPVSAEWRKVSRTEYGVEVKCEYGHPSVIRELYPDYWVLEDTREGERNGIFGLEMQSETIESAIEEAMRLTYTGDGVQFYPEQYDHVWSSACNCYHIFMERE